MQNNYQIDTLKFKEKGNRGVPIRIEKEIEKLIEYRSDIIDSLSNLKNNLNSINVEDVNYITFRYYGEIPPKTGRYVFRESKYISKPSDIPQIGISTYYDNSKPNTDLFYKVTREELENFIKWVDFFLSCNFEYDIDNENLMVIKKLVRIGDISQKTHAQKMSKPSFYRFVHIDEIINEILLNRWIPKEHIDLDNRLIYLTPDEFDKINKEFPFFLVYGYELTISSDKIEFSLEDIDLIIDEPTGVEPTIVVIDSGSSLDSSSLNSYVESIDDFRKYGTYSDKEHGSWVGSLIIANDELNPTHKDGFGNFKIRHYEVLEPMTEDDEGASVEFDYLIKRIEEIVKLNEDCKVFNLSLGGLKLPIGNLDISPVGNKLDLIALKYNVLFIVAAGNDGVRSGIPTQFSLNSPGDALNALTVGSTATDGAGYFRADYSSFGFLAHFEKPEVSNWGGPTNIDESPLQAHNLGIDSGIAGTSFSTPRISRLAAHLIHTLNMSPLQAKACIIGNAKRKKPSKKASSYGFVKNIDADINIGCEMTVVDTQPLYLPLDIDGTGVEEIILTTSHFANPLPELGEEYSINNISIKLIWYYDTDNPEYKGWSKVVEPKIKVDDKKFMRESNLRFESGKYFTTTKTGCKFDDVKAAKLELMKKVLNMDADKKPPANLEPKLAIRIKKLNLFETDFAQDIKVGVNAIFTGESVDLSRFEENNAFILVPIEIETYV